MSETKHPRRLDELENLDDFLKDEGVYDEVLAHATKRVIALQLRSAMKEQKLTKSAMADLMQTSRAQLDRVLDPDEFNVTVETLARAAKVLGRGLRINLA